MDYGGHIDGDGVQIYREPRRRHAPHTEFDVAAFPGLPRVDIAYSYGGADGTMVDALVAAGASGIVSAGLAPGIPASLEQSALERSRDAGVVVVANRAAPAVGVLRCGAISTLTTSIRRRRTSC